jgi:hypothetical protein
MPTVDETGLQPQSGRVSARYLEILNESSGWTPPPHGNAMRERCATLRDVFSLRTDNECATS